MQNQHRQIVGQRELDAKEISLINRIKVLSTTAGKLIDELGDDKDNDKRLLAIAWTNLQTGFMFATRAVEKPTS